MHHAGTETYLDFASKGANPETRKRMKDKISRLTKGATMNIPKSKAAFFKKQGQKYLRKLSSNGSASSSVCQEPAKSARGFRAKDISQNF